LQLAKVNSPEAGLIGVIDENPILAEALCLRLNEESRFRAYSAGWADPSDLLDLDLSLLILDPAQAPGPLAEVVPALRILNPGLRLIAYSSRPSVACARDCVREDFRAFLTKTSNFDQLLQAARAVAGGGMYFERRYARALVTADDPGDAGSGGEVDANGIATGAARLSEREIEVLRRISLGMSQKQIAADLEVSPKTIDTYRARGMQKLGLKDRSELVRHALETGWIE